MYDVNERKYLYKRNEGKTRYKCHTKEITI